MAYPRSRLQRSLAYGFRKAPWLVDVLRRLYRLGLPRFSAGVVGVIMNANDEILLVEHVFHPRYPWGLPGGWLGANEHPSEALKRELYEEAGLEIVIEDLLLVERWPHFQHLDVAYLCRPENAVGDLNAELLDFRWVALDDLPSKMSPFHWAAIDQARQQMKVEE